MKPENLFTLRPTICSAMVVVLILSPHQSAHASNKTGKFPLRQDERLRVRFDIVGEDPDLAIVLYKLSSATKLNVAMAEGLLHHAPKYGKLKLKNAPAWAIMEYIAQKQVKNGRWQKTADGYMLTGTSTAPSAQAQSGDWSVAKIIAGVIIAIGGLAFAVFCALALLRRPAGGPQRAAKR